VYEQGTQESSMCHQQIIVASAWRSVVDTRIINPAQYLLSASIARAPILPVSALSS
jgi:hypothetical protein